jgi:hypothetical protein
MSALSTLQKPEVKEALLLAVELAPRMWALLSGLSNGSMSQEMVIAQFAQDRLDFKAGTEALEGAMAASPPATPPPPDAG